MDSKASFFISIKYLVADSFGAIQKRCGKSLQKQNALNQSRLITFDSLSLETSPKSNIWYLCLMKGNVGKEKEGKVVNIIFFFLFCEF